MKSVPFLTLIFLALGCRSAPRISTPHPADELRLRTVALAGVFSPLVVDVLGTSSSTTRIGVEVLYLSGDVAGKVNEERDLISINSRLHPLSDRVLSWVIVHELTHVNLSGYWATLPKDIEEGVAEYVAAALVPDQVPVMLDQQPQEYHEAFLLVSAIGLDNLRVLCQQAHSSGYVEVPEEWLAVHR